MNVFEKLQSVLCGPDGKCNIVGSDGDRSEVDAALTELLALQSCERSMQGDIDHLVQALGDSETLLTSAASIIKELTDQNGSNVGIEDRVNGFPAAVAKLADWRSRDAFCHSSQTMLERAKDALARIGNPEFVYSTDDDDDTQEGLRMADARAVLNSLDRVPAQLDSYNTSHEVMNPPESAAMGSEARNLTSDNVMGLGEVHRASEARPANDVPAPSTCPLCSHPVSMRGRTPMCANCGWHGLAQPLPSEPCICQPIGDGEVLRSSKCKAHQKLGGEPREA